MRVGMEASGHARWFERLLSELRFELWIGTQPRFHEAGTQAEDRPPRCATDSALVAGRSLSADLGAELGEPRSAAVAVASSPDGAGTHTDHEPVASGGVE